MLRNFLLPVFSLVIFVNSSAWADVPYDSLEKIRQQTIVTRVIVDHPGKEMLKGCSTSEHLSALGQKLALSYENEDVVWANAIITRDDLPLLSKRAMNCRKRASCGIYSRFLDKAVKDQASAADVTKLLNQVDTWLNEMTTKDYLQALPSVHEACTVFKSLL